MLPTLILLSLVAQSVISDTAAQEIYLEQLLTRVHNMQRLVKEVENIGKELNINLKLANTPEL